MTQVNWNYLEFKQLEELINACSNPRDRAFIALLARTGVRISEVIELKVSDIDSKRGTLTIVRLKERTKLKCPHFSSLLLLSLALVPRVSHLFSGSGMLCSPSYPSKV